MHENIKKILFHINGIKKFKGLTTHMQAGMWENKESYSTGEHENIHTHFGKQFHII